MVSKRDGKLVLWPRYFDRHRTRAEGRRVAKEHAVENPKAGVISEAAKTLGLDPVLEKDVPHPSTWHKPEGRVLVDRKWSKEETLKRVADRL